MFFLSFLATMKNCSFVCLSTIKKWFFVCLSTMKNWFCCCLLIVSCVFRAALFAADSSQQAGAALPAGAPAAGHGGVPSRHQALLQPPSTGGRGKLLESERSV